MIFSQIPLIARSLRRNRITALVLSVQMMVATACVANLTSLLMDRLSTLGLDTGMQENGLLVVEAEFIGDPARNPSAAIATDVETLHRTPGVSDVVAVGSLPLSGRNWTAGFTDRPIEGDHIEGITEVEPSVYAVSAPAVRLLGLELIAGRDLSPDAFVAMRSKDGYAGLHSAGEAVLSEAMARRIFPGSSAVGRFIYADARYPVRVVGVVRRLSRPVLRNHEDDGLSLMLPLVPDTNRVMYAIRESTGVAGIGANNAREVLFQLDPTRSIVSSTTFGELRSDYLRHDQIMAIVFLSATLALLLVTAIGVYGLSSFWVRRRYRQIAIRRALGARRVDVMVYFLVENLMLAAASTLIGTAAAMGINLLVARHYEVARLGPSYLLAAALAVILLGQIAAFVPAWRGARQGR